MQDTEGSYLWCLSSIGQGWLLHCREFCVAPANQPQDTAGLSFVTFVNSSYTQFCDFNGCFERAQDNKCLITVDQFEKFPNLFSTL